MPAKEWPNLLLIMSDEQAPMYSGPYRHPLVQTPHIDRLAEDGVPFTNAAIHPSVCRLGCCRSDLRIATFHAVKFS